MLHCLALGSIVYYALELLHSHLESELVIEELTGEVHALEKRLDEVRWGADETAEGKSAGARGWGGWKLW